MADDILIGGTTSHDASNTALTALINEWKSTASYDSHRTPDAGPDRRSERRVQLDDAHRVR